MISLSINPNAQLQGKILLESPFRVWNCRLNNFTGGAFSYVSPNTSLHQVTIGRYCSIGHGVEILSSHPLNGLTTSPFPYQTIFAPPFDSQPQIEFNNLELTQIGNDVWVGAGVKIMTGVKIGDGAVIGAGSIVTKDIAPYAIVAGSPAKIIRMRFPEKTIERLIQVRWWQYNLIGMNLRFNEPESALDEIHSLIVAKSAVPHPVAYYRIWREGNDLKARPTF